MVSDTVKKWWPKVVAAAGADNEQAILDLEGVSCVVCGLTNLRLNRAGENSIDYSHFTTYHTTHVTFQGLVCKPKI